MTHAQSLEGLVAAVEALQDAEAKARARALVTGVLSLHRDALEGLVAGLLALPDGEALLHALSQDTALSAALMLHGLHPRSTLARAQDALDALSPRLRGLGARIHEVSLQQGILRIRLLRDDPSRNGAAITRLIESTLLEVAPDAELLLEGAQDSAKLVSALRLAERR